MYHLLLEGGSATYRLHVNNSETKIMQMFEAHLREVPPVDINMFTSTQKVQRKLLRERKMSTLQVVVTMLREPLVLLHFEPLTAAVVWRASFHGISTQLQLYYSSSCNLMWVRIANPPFYSERGFYSRRAPEMVQIRHRLDLASNQLIEFYYNVYACLLSQSKR